MSLIDRDVLLRQIRFLQQLLARVRKTQSEKDLPTAIDEVHGGYREALGVPHELLSRLDVGSALSMLRTPERRQAYLELLRVEAELLRQHGDTSAAAGVERRVAQLERTAAV